MNHDMQLPEDLADALRTANRVAVLTGAGVSAESGIPTFRDAHEGLWARYDPMTLADWHLPGPGGHWLPLLVKALEER